jgi:hypothetical protein
MSFPSWHLYSKERNKIEILFLLNTIHIERQIHKLMNSVDQDTVIGLKTQINRQVAFKKDAIEYGQYLEKQLIFNWRVMLMNGISREMVYRLIWDMVENSSVDYAIPTESKFVGVYTTIGEYTNTKNRKHLAHFTQGGKYIGTVKNLGNKPISYQMYASITRYRSYVDIDFDRIMRDETAQALADIFKIK